MNKEKLYVFIAEYPDCVVVRSKAYGTYTVQDKEHDCIAMVNTEERAREIASNYSLEEVRRQKKEEFNTWFKEFVQA